MRQENFVFAEIDSKLFCRRHMWLQDIKMTVRSLKTRWKEAGLLRHCNHPSTVRAQAQHFDLAWWTIETVMLILDYVAGPTTETSCSTWCGSEFAAFAVVLLHLPATVVFYRPGRWMKEVQNVPIKLKFFNLWLAAKTLIWSCLCRMIQYFFAGCCCKSDAPSLSAALGHCRCLLTTELNNKWSTFFFFFGFCLLLFLLTSS